MPWGRPDTPVPMTRLERLVIVFVGLIALFWILGWAWLGPEVVAP